MPKTYPAKKNILNKRDFFKNKQYDLDFHMSKALWYDKKREEEKNIVKVRRAIGITEHCTNVHTVTATMFSRSNEMNKTRR